MTPRELVQLISGALHPHVEVVVVDVKDRAFLVRETDGDKAEWMVGVQRIKT